MEVKTTREITSNFFEAQQDGKVLNGLEQFCFDYLERGMDGVFKNKASWTKFLNRVENGELTNWLEYKTKNSYIKSIDYETIEIFDNDGIKVSTGYIYNNGKKEFIYDTYKKMEIKIDYEFGFFRNSVDNNADCVDIYGEIINLYKE